MGNFNTKIHILKCFMNDRTYKKIAVICGSMRSRMIFHADMAKNSRAYLRGKRNGEEKRVNLTVLVAIAKSKSYEHSTVKIWNRGV